MPEPRRSQRIRTFKGGSILFGTAPAIVCLIRNMSETGACLEIEGPSGPACEFRRNPAGHTDLKPAAVPI
jgi:hypothetical protein